MSITFGSRSPRCHFARKRFYRGFCVDGFSCVGRRKQLGLGGLRRSWGQDRHQSGRGWCLYGAECQVDSSTEDLGALWLLDCIWIMWFWWLKSVKLWRDSDGLKVIQVWPRFGLFLGRCVKHLILVSSPQSVSRSFSACFPNTVGEGVLPEVPVSGLGGLLSKRVLSSQLSFTFPSLKFFFFGGPFHQALFEKVPSPGSLPMSARAYWNWWEQMLPAFLHIFWVGGWVSKGWELSLFGGLSLMLRDHFLLSMFQLNESVTSTSLRFNRASLPVQRGSAVLSNGAAGPRPDAGGPSESERTPSALMSAETGKTHGKPMFPKIMVPQNGWFIMENPIRKIRSFIWLEFTCGLCDPDWLVSEALSMWSEGHVWCSPEMHGTITGAFKNQIDWCLGKLSASLTQRQGLPNINIWAHHDISPSLIANGGFYASSQTIIKLPWFRLVKSHTNPRPKDGTKIMLWIGRVKDPPGSWEREQPRLLMTMD